jgi:hypothetical protein
MASITSSGPRTSMSEAVSASTDDKENDEKREREDGARAIRGWMW